MEANTNSEQNMDAATADLLNHVAATIDAFDDLDEAVLEDDIFEAKQALRRAINKLSNAKAAVVAANRNPNMVR